MHTAYQETSENGIFSEPLEVNNNAHTAEGVLRGERAARGAQPPLGNNANNVVATYNPRSGRDARYAARGTLWELTGLERVRKCGRVPVRPAGTVDVRIKDGVAGYAGLATCGSVWACPVCSAKIQAVRRGELEALVEWAHEQGYSLVFTTVTVPHNAGQRLQQIWDGLAAGYRAVGQSKRVREMRQELGFGGYVRATEVTHGKNSWHPHMHVLSLVDAVNPDENEEDEARLNALADAEFEVFERAVVKAGLRRPQRAQYHWQIVTSAADYLTKSTFETSKVTFEMQGAATKQGRKKSRTPFQILADFTESYDADDGELWLEYERVSKGRRALTWSRGLKDAIGIDDISDEDLVEEEIGDQEDDVFTIAEWQRDVAPRPILASRLLTAVEQGGRSAGEAFCALHGIELLSAASSRVQADRAFDARRYGTSLGDVSIAA